MPFAKANGNDPRLDHDDLRLTEVVPVQPCLCAQTTEDDLRAKFETYGKLVRSYSDP